MFFGNLHLRMAYDSAREQYMTDNPPAFKTGAKSCNRCALCCWTRPPRLSKYELHRLAERFGLTDAEFFQKRCVIDNPGTSNYCPVLIRTHQTDMAGHYLQTSETYSFDSPCSFLSRADGVHSCELQSDKPPECAGHECWNPTDVDSKKYEWTDEELKALGWDGEDTDYDDDDSGFDNYSDE